MRRSRYLISTAMRQLHQNPKMPWQPLIPNFEFRQRRLKHTHRTIQIQLKEVNIDVIISIFALIWILRPFKRVPGLGKPGTLHWVRPGRMRNHLFPKGLANYVVKGVRLEDLTVLEGVRPAAGGSCALTQPLSA